MNIRTLDVFFDQERKGTENERIKRVEELRAVMITWEIKKDEKC